MSRTIATRLILTMVCAVILAQASPAFAQSKSSKSTKSSGVDGAKATKPQGTDGAKQIASLDGVTWEGAGASIGQLKGKTVLVLTYVTWCPKCNEWAPKLLAELKKTVTDKPVIVLAINTDPEPTKAREYMEPKDFVGPNILHGYDSKLAKSFGFENEFFNYVIIGPDGELAHSGKFHSPIASSQLQTTKDLGKFRFVDPKMSPALQDLLWPMELGNVAAMEKSLKKAEKSLKPDDREMLKTTLEHFLDDELETAQESATGEPSQKIDALEKATFLASNFKAAQQGKEAKKLVAELTKDKTLKKEISAKRMYELSMQTPDLDRRVVLLEKAAKQFPDTHYGTLAEQAVAAAKQ
jgi:thiol-disulfide isomerase/thioredoxin